MPGLEILKSHPNLFLVSNFHFEPVKSSRRGTLRIRDLAIQPETAVVAWAEIVLFLLPKIHEATRVRAHHVQRLHRILSGSSQVNRTDRRIGEFVPRVHAAG